MHLINSLQNENKSLAEELNRLTTQKCDLQITINRVKSGKIFRIKTMLSSAFTIAKKMLNPNHLRKNIYLLQTDPLLLKLRLQAIYREYRPINIHSIYLIQSPTQNQKQLLVDIVIPWYGDMNIIKLLDDLLHENQLIEHIYIINDSYPNDQVVSQVESYISGFNNSRINFLHNNKNKGFVFTANRGLQLSQNEYVILMNSDTRVAKNWIQKMLMTANLNKKIATVTPMSNNATIFSLPKFLKKNSLNDIELTNALIEKLTTHRQITVPTCHGFCVLIKKKYLDMFGYLDEKTFGKGYGEENDLSMNFAQHGLINVADTTTYVGHLESQSFGDEQREKYIKENYEKLIKKHPTYHQLVHEFIIQNPFGQLQDLLSFFEQKSELVFHESILIILHSNPLNVIGGVERETLLLLKDLNKKNYQKNIQLFFYDQQKKLYVLHILKNFSIQATLHFSDKISPQSILEWIVKAMNIKQVIIEHLLHHSLEYGKILKQAHVPFIVFIHDFYFLTQIPDQLTIDSRLLPFDVDKNVLNYESKKINGKSFVPNHLWMKQAKNFLNIYAEQVIFNSEFTYDIYIKHLLKQPNNKFIISYPSIDF